MKAKSGIAKSMRWKLFYLEGVEGMGRKCGIDELLVELNGDFLLSVREIGCYNYVLAQWVSCNKYGCFAVLLLYASEDAGAWSTEMGVVEIGVILWCVCELLRF